MSMGNGELKTQCKKIEKMSRTCPSVVEFQEGQARYYGWLVTFD
jgi:hypothetical protein